MVLVDCWRIGQLPTGICHAAHSLGTNPAFGGARYARPRLGQMVAGCDVGLPSSWKCSRSSGVVAATQSRRSRAREVSHINSSDRRICRGNFDPGCLAGDMQGDQVRSAASFAQEIDHPSAISHRFPQETMRCTLARSSLAPTPRQASARVSGWRKRRSDGERDHLRVGHRQGEGGRRHRSDCSVPTWMM